MGKQILVDSNEMETSSPCFQFKWEVKVDSTTDTTTRYYIYTYLKWVGGNGGTPKYVTTNYCPVVNPTTGVSENCLKYDPNTFVYDIQTLSRMRYLWEIKYTIDDYVYTRRYDTFETALPDDNAAVGTENTGHLHMKQNVWYQWGEPYINVWTNNGAQTKINVVMKDISGFNYPAYCPSSNTPYVSTKVITRPLAGADKPLEAPYVHISGPWYAFYIYWAAVENSTGYKVQCSVNGSSWKDVRWYETTLTYTPETSFIFDPGDILRYRVVATNPKGDLAISNVVTAPMIQGGFKIKKDSAWRNGTAYIRVSGHWIKADYILFKHNNTWLIPEQ